MNCFQISHRVKQSTTCQRTIYHDTQWVPNSAWIARVTWDKRCKLACTKILKTFDLTLYIYIYIYITIKKVVDLSRGWPKDFLFDSMIVREFANGPGDLSSVPGQVIPKTQKWYLMPPCLTLSIIMYGSRVKWSNPGKGVATSLTFWYRSYKKWSLRVTLDYGRQHNDNNNNNNIYIYIYIYLYMHKIIIIVCVYIIVMIIIIIISDNNDIYI